MIAADSILASSSKKKGKGRRKKVSVNEKQQEDDNDSRSFAVNFCFSEKVIEIRRPKTSPIIIGEECQFAIAAATQQFEEIYGSTFTWDEPIVNFPFIKDTNDPHSVVHCLLVSNDKIDCQLIEPTVATTAVVTENVKKSSSTILLPTHEEGSASCGGCEMLKSDITELINEIRERNSRIDQLIDKQNSKLDKIDKQISQTACLIQCIRMQQKIHIRMFIDQVKMHISSRLLLKAFPESNSDWYSFLSDVLSSPEDLGKLGLTQEAVETIRDYNKDRKLNASASSSAVDIALAIAAMEESAEKELFKTVLYPMLFDGLTVDDVFDDA